MFDNTVHPNGQKENEETLIKRCIGLGRKIRKNAANQLELKFSEYKEAEVLIMEKDNTQTYRLKDTKRYSGRRK